MALTQLSSTALSLTAYDQLAYFALRPQQIYDGLATVKGDNLTTPGKTISFEFVADLAAATTALTETADVTPVAISDSQTTITLAEYGNAVQTTAQARAFDFIPVNPLVANVLGFNGGITQDTLARNALQAGTNVIYPAALTSRATVTASSTLTGQMIMKAVAQLQTNLVQPWSDNLYRGVIHPQIAYDLRLTTGAGGWNDVHVYSSPDGIFQGVIGTFAGVQFMQSARAPLFADAGSPSTVDVYGTLILGQQALAKGYSTAGGYTNGANPTYVQTPVVDTLSRFTGMGWKWLGGYGIFRQSAVVRVESASSIGANT